MLAAGVLLTRSAFLAASSLLSPAVLSESGHHRTEDYRAWAFFVRSRVASKLDHDVTLTGPLLRLAFHDAATMEHGPTYLGTGAIVTGGPNGSIKYEMDDWSENRALRRPLDVVQGVYAESKLQQHLSTCDTTFSLADAIALAGTVAVEHAGGPHIAIRLGRKDSDAADPVLLRVPVSKTSERSRVDRTLPSAGLDSVGLRLYFGGLGLSEEEFVALSGAHNVGRHVTLLGMSKSCLKNLSKTCLENAPVSMPFVSSGVDTFSNAYYQGLLRWYDRQVEPGEVAFIPTDVALVVDDGLRRQVKKFAQDKDLFFRTFRRAYQKLVDSTATTTERY